MHRDVGGKPHDASENDQAAPKPTKLEAGTSSYDTKPNVERIDVVSPTQAVQHVAMNLPFNIESIFTLPEAKIPLNASRERIKAHRTDMKIAEENQKMSKMRQFLKTKLSEKMDISEVKRRELWASK